MNSIHKLFDAFNDLKVLIIGDVMVDAYLWGTVDRISPEAPVPIVAVKKRESRLGGAANVAINIKSMGATPILCSVIGNDRNGAELIDLMNELKMSTQGMIQSDERVTTVKTRVIGNNHQLLRVDDEVMHDLSSIEQSSLFTAIQSLIETEKPSVVIFEDYDKGVLNPSLIQAVVTSCKKAGIPTAVDPKKKNFNAYQGVDLFKPNLIELKQGVKVDFKKPDLATLTTVCEEFRTNQHIKTMMVTLSEHGVYIGNEMSKTIIPAHIRNISDVSGAGDTVISVAALCLGLGLDEKMIASLANLAGGLVCEQVGVVPIDKELLKKEAEQLLS
ncbi:MAG: bifunctional heptose 7-phosphate kinase/heptose 1-phosphate adenyltransferase [Bacteroidota bacterium]